MESDPHLNSSAALETTLYALTQWAKPSRMGLAYRRFLHGVEQHSDTAGAALPALWEKPYRDLLVEVRDTVTHPFTHKVAISDRVRNALDIVGLLESYYGPANDLHLKEDHASILNGRTGTAATLPLPKLLPKQPASCMSSMC